MLKLLKYSRTSSSFHWLKREAAQSNTHSSAMNGRAQRRGTPAFRSAQVGGRSRGIMMRIATILPCYSESQAPRKFRATRSSSRAAVAAPHAPAQHPELRLRRVRQHAQKFDQVPRGGAEIQG